MVPPEGGPPGGTELLHVGHDDLVAAVLPTGVVRYDERLRVVATSALPPRVQRVLGPAVLPGSSLQRLLAVDEAVRPRPVLTAPA